MHIKYKLWCQASINSPIGILHLSVFLRVIVSQNELFELYPDHMEEK